MKVKGEGGRFKGREGGEGVGMRFEEGFKRRGVKTLPGETPEAGSGARTRTTDGCSHDHQWVAYLGDCPSDLCGHKNISPCFFSFEQ